MTAKNECHHGSLRRSCDRCDMEQYIEELQRALARAAEEIARSIDRIRAAEARAEKLQAEVDRLTRKIEDEPL